MIKGRCEICGNKKLLTKHHKGQIPPNKLSGL